MDSLDFKSTQPENPRMGEAFMNMVDRSVSVYNGAEWIKFSEYEMAEMQVMSLLTREGLSEKQATHIIHVLQHGHIHTGQ